MSKEYDASEAMPSTSKALVKMIKDQFNVNPNVFLDKDIMQDPYEVGKLAGNLEIIEFIRDLEGDQ